MVYISSGKNVPCRLETKEVYDHFRMNYQDKYQEHIVQNLPANNKGRLGPSGGFGSIPGGQRGGFGTFN